MNLGRNKYMRVYRKSHPEYGKNRDQSRATLGVKAVVLAHYGKGKKPKCRWRGCDIIDLDMLSIDHVADDGAAHRKQIAGSEKRCGGGINLYRKLRAAGFPEGFQTLCHNHQWKKEIQRRRMLSQG